MIKDGQIENRKKWLEAKAMDHSEWDFLPRGCKPSDVDGMVELDGRFLFMEFKTQDAKGVKMAQQRAFQQLVRMGQGKVVAVFAITRPVQGDTKSISDVEWFQALRWVEDKVVTSPPIEGGRWRRWLEAWLAKKI